MPPGMGGSGGRAARAGWDWILSTDATGAPLGVEGVLDHEPGVRVVDTDAVQ
jgi:hypothetical protein